MDNNIDCEAYLQVIAFLGTFSLIKFRQLKHQKTQNSFFRKRLEIANVIY